MFDENISSSESTGRAAADRDKRAHKQPSWRPSRKEPCLASFGASADLADDSRAHAICNVHHHGMLACANSV